LFESSLRASYSESATGSLRRAIRFVTQSKKTERENQELLKEHEMFPLGNRVSSSTHRAQASSSLEKMCGLSNEHINGFRKSVVFPTFFANVKPFFDNIQEMRHYKITEVSKKK
jgi:hypothetical protein